MMSNLKQVLAVRFLFRIIESFILFAGFNACCNLFAVAPQHVFHSCYKVFYMSQRT